MELLSEKRLMWPEGNITRLAPASAAVYALAIFNSKTIVDLNPTEAGTIDLTIDAECPDGAELIVNVNQDGVGRAISMGTGIEGDNLAGVANDKDTLILVYNKDAATFRVASNYKTVNAV